MKTIEFNNRLIEIQEKLNYFARSLTTNMEEAKDLVQDTNIKALTNKDKFEPGSNIKAWTYTIMKNTFINNYRKKSKSNILVDNSQEPYILNTRSISKQALPDSKIALDEIERNIKSMNHIQRKPFVMHHQGYKYKEIAEFLNLSIGTVKSRIFFTRQKLMKQYLHQNPPNS